MFGKKSKSKAIVPVSNAPIQNISNNKITPSIPVPVKDLSTNTNTNTNTNIDALNQMRDTQQLSNAEFLTLSLLKQMLLTLGKIEVNTAEIVKNSQFTSAYLINKFKWL